MLPTAPSSPPHATAWSLALALALLPAARQDEATRTTIAAVQGAGPRSSLEGMSVAVEGVVTAFARDGVAFWIQSRSPDESVATSEGVRVYPGAAAHSAQVGDLVRVHAVVREREFRGELSVTTLAEPLHVDVLERDVPLPPPAELHPATRSISEAIAAWERHEGMRVQLQDAPVIGPTSRYGEFVALPRAHARSDSGFATELSVQRLRPLEAGGVDYNLGRVLVSTASDRFSRTPALRPGDRIRRLVGVVDYSYANYKVVATELDADVSPTPRWPVSRRSGPAGDFVITSFNVENLFDLDDEPGKNDESSTPSKSAHETKLQKLALALRFELALPQVLVLQEVENAVVLEALAELVNAAADTEYRARAFGSSDGRGIENAFLIDEARVRFVEGGLLNTPDIQRAYAVDSKGREPAFALVEAQGHLLTIIGNHFKSKSGDDALFGARQPPMRSTELTRKAQARALRQWLDAKLESDPEAWVVVAGDLNDFSFAEPGEGEDHPVGILIGEGARALYPVLPLEDAPDRFTYLFQGNAQTLDHVFVSAPLRERVRGVDVLHINSTWPAHFASMPHVPMRCSDHDPVELRLRLAAGESGSRRP